MVTLSLGEPIPANQRPSWTASRAFRFALLFALGMTEVMPVALLSYAMPAILRRNGASMEQLGLLSLVMTPWAVKALWAPLVDKLGARSPYGRYRSWLLITHTLLLVTLVLGAFSDIPALLQSKHAVDMPALFLLSLVASTADIASHGLAVNLLSPEERGLGNGVQTAGMMTGTLVGGGLMLMLIDILGWRSPLLIIAAAVLLSLVGVALYQEPPVDPAHAITLRAALAFFRRPRIGRWLLILAMLLLIPSLPTVPFQALFVDKGMGLAELGLVLGVLSSTAGILGGTVAGIFVKGFGRGRAFFSAQLLCVACISTAYVIVTRSAPGRTLLYISAAAVAFGLALITTTMRVLMMDRSRGHLASSDYSIQASMGSLFGFLGVGAGGYLAGYIGAGKLFVVAPVLMLAAIYLVSRIFFGDDFSPKQDLRAESPQR